MTIYDLRRDIEVLEEAKYIVSRGLTLRSAAKELGISKSKLHIDLNKHLKNIDLSLYESFRELMKYNFDRKHLRGGESTKQKYASLKLTKKD